MLRQDWHFNGTDIMYVIRAGYRGAESMHNSNRVLFSRLRDWQQHLPQTTCSAIRATFAAGESAGCQQGTRVAVQHMACSGTVMALGCNGIDEPAASLSMPYGATTRPDAFAFGRWVCSTNGNCQYHGT